MPDFQLSEKAVDDLRSIARYTQEKWGRDQRNKYLYMLDAGFNAIAQQPEIGIACDYIRTGYRKHHVGRHLIFYRQSANWIEIVRILHERIDVPNQLEKA